MRMRASAARSETERSRIARIDRSAAQAHNAAGRSALLESRHDEAIAAFRAALRSDPSFAMAANNLGKALIDMGELTEAAQCFTRAIRLEPDNAHYYLSLVTVARAQLDPVDRDALLRLGKHVERLPVAQQIDAHFALGSLHERACDVEAAFRHFRAANALKRAEISYDEAAERRFLRTSRATFSHPIMDGLRGCGDGSERPIFIFGMPRSGSTLVEQILAAHPDVASAGELGIFGAIVRNVWEDLAASTLPQLRFAIRQIGERYLRATDGLAPERSRLTDKTLYNVQFAPLIAVTLPNARMIHVHRDPLDTCFSNYATLFAPLQVPFSYDLGELGRYYAAYAELAERWRERVPADRYLDVRYEELIADFPTVARRIVGFCGLAWDPACLSFHSVRRPVLTASSVAVRQPLYRDSVARAQPFVPFLGPLIEALGGGLSPSA